MADNIINIDKLISEQNLDLTSVHKDYPTSCLPIKFKPPSTEKAKKALTEAIDTNTYEEAAHMVAFKIPHPKLLYWIKSLQLVYYEHYGKSAHYDVNWHDEPGDWVSANTSNKQICIDLSTKEDEVDGNLLLYKITLFINTGLIQIHGNQKDNFVARDFPALLTIVNRISKHKDNEGLKSTKEGTHTDDTCMSEETFVKEINREAVQIEGSIRPEKASGNTTKEVNKESTVIIMLMSVTLICFISF